jgi:hypothetical protein
MLNKKLANGFLLSGLALVGLFSLTGAAPAIAQSALAQQSTKQQNAKSSTAKSTAAKPAAKPAAAPAKKSPAKPLVYVEDDRSANKTADSKSADASASKPADASVKKASDTSANKTSNAPASQKPLSADLTKAFAQNCPSVALTDSKSKAAYEVMLEREPGSKGVKSAFGLTNAVHKTSKIEVMSKTGKELFSETGHSTGQLVKDACTAIGTPGTKVAKN